MTLVAPPSEFHVGRHKISRSSNDAYDGDARGILWLYEPPNPRARYVLGCDPTFGRTGWSRFNRTEDDNRIDNGAIEVLRLGRGEPGSPYFQPHVQVAEYAAPVDQYDLAKVVNFLGRMYSGREEDAQAKAIIEVYPGPGGPVQNELEEKYGYTNFYEWQYLDTGRPANMRKSDRGWYSTKQSVPHLWSRGLRAIHRKQIIFRSPYLVEELADCSLDLLRMRGEAEGSGHDDRAVAMLLAIWLANNWSFTTEYDDTTRAVAGKINEWQNSAISSERLQEAWESRWEEICREVEQELG